MSNPRSDLTLNSFPQLGQQARSTSPATSNPSPIDPSSGTGSGRSPFGLPPPGLGGSSKMAGSRSGNGSPSHELGSSSRLYSKRAREIQAQEGIPGMPVNLWPGPPTSGNSTPLRETIPESPTDGFPDFAQLPSSSDFLPLPVGRRARAGTVPSRFSPGGVGAGLLGLPAVGTAAPKTSRPTPSQTPFKSPSPSLEAAEGVNGATSSSALLSRLRAGSMPQRAPFSQAPPVTSPFGPSIFSSWNPTTRERGSTLASIASLGSNGPSSPAQSAFSREGTADTDVHMRTLDYLGLVETPQPPRATLATPYMPNIADLSRSSRFRSYSVNNKDKYADEDDEDDFDTGMAGYGNDYAAVLQGQIDATNAAIHNHNLAVQAFVSAASRPRARTAGVLDAPGARVLRNYYPTPSRLDNSLSAADIQLPEEKDFDEQLATAVAGMALGRSNSRNNNGANAAGGAGAFLSPDEPGLEGPTSALWLGSIPTSTTTSTLTEMFKSYGPILSARVLTLKNCGFVNFERVESAVAAKASLNGKEIFPGAGPVRINFAKPPSSSNTPGHDGVFPSPSPDPFAAEGKLASGASAGPGTSLAGLSAPGGLSAATGTAGAEGAPAGAGSSAIPPAVSSPAALSKITNDVLRIVGQFGASDEDAYVISTNLQQAVQFTAFIDEIPSVPEPSSTRVYDAPKLRDIRKRIDNQSYSQAEIERIAVEMLPEIAELASDYLGNTVVQKLFEHCSDSLRDDMLAEIAPHLAEIGIHKNGTWAAQKIIDVCKTPQQMSLIAESVRPYTVPLFLDQYGNYVLQGCLKFGAPYTDYIFETMISRLWEIAQGRFGARAMRACLESHHATKDQQRMLAAVIALNSVQLATNANGALLLTWFLDTCTFPQRRTVLAPQLVPYLVHLCTHKVAYLTVLKVVNQKAEPEARDTILQALFSSPNDRILEAILSDNACGSTLIYKVITTPFFEESLRGQIVESVKNVLVRIKAQPSQGYKRLMDEVGLSTRGSGGSGGASGGEHRGSRDRDHSSNNEKQRPTSRQTNGHQHQNHHGQQGNHQQQSHSHAHQQHQSQQPASQQQQQQRTPPHANQGAFNSGGTGPYFNSSPNPPGFDGGFNMPRGDNGSGIEAGVVPPNFGAYNGQAQMYMQGQGGPTMGQMPPYQQGMMGGRGVNPNMGGGYYPPPMQAGFGSFNGSGVPSSMDAYRNGSMPNSNNSIQAPPMGGLAGQAPYVPPGYNNNMGTPYGYGGPPPPYMSADQMGGAGGNGRRGRPGRNPNRDISPRQFH
ncbi:hypothetical protein SBRCBS47491_006754 [Sporothrix bragantina]|uniref:RNA-binding protein n=1 Tax=Sporothrix bragantina TaxID=671064 RepID=A0ABP0C7I9_9PEZI